MSVISTVRESLAARRTAVAKRRTLAAELAAFSTPADRLEIEAIVGRYPEEQTREVRDILDRQAA